jgi:hypothetical protein
MSVMKNYAFQLLCAIACFFLLMYRPWPGIVVVVIAYAIVVASCVITAIGVKKAVDDMWWRIALAAVSILIIGLAQAR